MKKTKRRGINVILAFVFVFSMLTIFPISARAEEDQTIESASIKVTPPTIILQDTYWYPEIEVSEDADYFLRRTADSVGYKNGRTPLYVSNANGDLYDTSYAFWEGFKYYIKLELEAKEGFVFDSEALLEAEGVETICKKEISEDGKVMTAIVSGDPTPKPSTPIESIDLTFNKPPLGTTAKAASYGNPNPNYGQVKVVTINSEGFEFPQEYSGGSISWKDDLGRYLKDDDVFEINNTYLVYFSIQSSDAINDFTDDTKININGDVKIKDKDIGINYGLSTLHLTLEVTYGEKDLDPKLLFQFNKTQFDETTTGLSDMIALKESLYVNSSCWELEDNSGEGKTEYLAEGTIKAGTKVEASVFPKEHGMVFSVQKSDGSYVKDLRYTSHSDGSADITFTMPEENALIKINMSSTKNVNFDLNGGVPGVDWYMNDVKKYGGSKKTVSLKIPSELGKKQSSSELYFDAYPPEGYTYAGVEVTAGNFKKIYNPGDVTEALDITNDINVKLLWGKHSLKLHWSSLDGLDLEEPIVINNIVPGTTVGATLESAGLSYEDVIFERTGYHDGGYGDKYRFICRCSKPMTEYVDCEDIYNTLAEDTIKKDDLIESDMDIYVFMFKVIDSIEAEIKAPICGTETNTMYDDDEDEWIWDGQTNIPELILPEGALYHVYEKDGCKEAHWYKSNDVDAPFIGTFEGGNDYEAGFLLEFDFGYMISEDANIRLNNATDTRVAPIIGIRSFLSATVGAVHDWGDWTVTKEATKTEAGEETRICKANPSHKETRSIDKFPDDEKPSDKDSIKPTEKGASAEDADKAITAMTDDKDPAGSTFAILQLKSGKQTKNSIKINWKKAPGAVKYVVYGNKCGKANKMTKLAELSGNTKSFKTIAGKKVKKGTYYKFIVVAIDKDNKVVSTSKVIHVATKGGKVGNNKKVIVKAKSGKKYKAVSKVSIKAGKTLKLKTTLTKVSKKQKVKKHVAIRYESSNTAVATVNNKGAIKAVSKGSCVVYVYAQNGVMKAVKVTVK